MGMFDEVREVPKPNHKRRVPKRKERGRIKPQVYRKVYDRDNGMCVMCGRGYGLEAHHVRYRSQLGTGDEWNIVMLCFSCHQNAHSSREVRKRLEDYMRRLYPREWQARGS